MKNLFTVYSGLILFMRIKKLLVCPMIITIFAAGSVMAQLQDKTLKGNDQEFFYFDPLVFYSKEQSKARLDVYIEIPMDNLQFKKNYSTKLYDASISYTIKITNAANEIITNETISDSVTTKKEDQKKLDEASKYIVKEFYLNPGMYKLEITLADVNTKKEKTKQVQLSISDNTQKDITFSDIMLVSNLKEENGQKVITPLVDKNIDNLKEFYLFFEVYNSKSDSVVNNFTYKITNNKDNKIIEKGNYTFTFSPGANKVFEKISTTNLVFGNYKIEINDNTNGELLAKKEFVNKLNGFPINEKDLEVLTNELIYIANGEELSKIKNAPTPELKERYFVEFWRSKDPSPNSARNELMIEYYRRIKVANERYTHYIDGWKTDMGMVYIIFGDPSSIERYPFTENTKPYEVWEFYSENKQFVFVDETGFGDFKLTVPIWDHDHTKINH